MDLFANAAVMSASGHNELEAQDEDMQGSVAFASNRVEGTRRQNR
jgi:hypothetical protein